MGGSLEKFLGIEKWQDVGRVSTISLTNSHLLYYSALMQVYVAKDELILFVSNASLIVTFHHKS